MFNVLNTEEKGKLETILKKSKLFRKEVENDSLAEEEKTVEIKNETLCSILREIEKTGKKNTRTPIGALALSLLSL